MPEHHAPVSVSLKKETLSELRDVAGRRRTSASKVAEEGIALHLRALRATNGDAPSLTFSLKGKLREYTGRTAIDPTIGRWMRRGSADMPPKPPPPDPYRIGGAFLTFAKPVTPEMAERVAAAAEHELAVLWGEVSEAERSKESKRNGTR